MAKRKKPKKRHTDDRAPAPEAAGGAGRLPGERRDDAPGQSPAPAGDEITWSEFVEFADRLFTYAERCLTPQRLAEIRRRRGDAAASPRDYDCRCPVPHDDCLPDCWPKQIECRFRHRMRPRPKFHSNKFAHALTREIFAELKARLRQMPEPELDAIIRKAAAFCEADRKRTMRLRAAPQPEPAPLKKNWRMDGLN